MEAFKQPAPTLAQIRALAAKLEAEDRRIQAAKAKVAAGAPNMEIVWERVRTPATRLIIAGLQQHRHQDTPRSRRAWKALCKRAMRHNLLRVAAATSGAQ
jgi:hypothetical protein